MSEDSGWVIKGHCNPQCILPRCELAVIQSNLTTWPSLTNQRAGNDNLTPRSPFFSDPGYVLYSAIGSFFAPMMVMIFFNWRIYLVASKTTRAIRRGFTKVCMLYLLHVLKVVVNQGYIVVRMKSMK